MKRLANRIAGWWFRTMLYGKPCWCCKAELGVVHRWWCVRRLWPPRLLRWVNGLGTPYSRMDLHPDTYWQRPFAYERALLWIGNVFLYSWGVDVPLYYTR